MLKECGMTPSLPLLIKGQGRDSAAPLRQSSHWRRRESGSTRCPNQRRPGFPPQSPATRIEDAWRASRIEGTGEDDRSLPRDHGAWAP